MINDTIVPAARIETKIYFIRGVKVMLDYDLADLYGVTTKALNQAVRRNLARFPKDFVFQLAFSEVELIRSQIVTLSQSPQWFRYFPYAFTELGVAMLSSVLKSERAIAVNIQIMRTFTHLREILLDNDHLRLKVEAMEKNYDENFKVVFDAIRRLLEDKAQPQEEIGFSPK